MRGPPDLAASIGIEMLALEPLPTHFETICFLLPEIFVFRTNALESVTLRTNIFSVRARGSLYRGVTTVENLSQQSTLTVES